MSISLCLDILSLSLLLFLSYWLFLSISIYTFLPLYILICLYLLETRLQDFVDNYGTDSGESLEGIAFYLHILLYLSRRALVQIMLIQLVHNPLATVSNEAFLQYFQEILKRTFQNFYKIFSPYYTQKMNVFVHSVAYIKLFHLSPIFSLTHSLYLSNHLSIYF